jgi:hypothetical protein
MIYDFKMEKLRVAGPAGGGRKIKYQKLKSPASPKGFAEASKMTK